MKQILLFLLGFPVCAQTELKGVVSDAETGKPIPYVNIWIENGQIGVTSETDGTFVLTVAADSNLVFSAVGYESKTIKATEANQVKLTPVIFSLDEVVIAKPTRKFAIEIGDSKRKAHTHLSGQTPWIYAKFFPYKLEYSTTQFIKDAIVFTNSKLKKATFKLRIFEVNEKGLPGADMVNEDIIITTAKGWQKNTIDLSKYNLKMPENGIFIGYEWMIIESNKYEMDYKLDGKKVHQVSYYPTVVCNPIEREHTYKFLGGFWFQDKAIQYEGDFKNKVIEPAINLTLTN